jgi:hypothetical protein
MSDYTEHEAVALFRAVQRLKVDREKPDVVEFEHPKHGTRIFHKARTVDLMLDDGTEVVNQVWRGGPCVVCGQSFEVSTNYGTRTENAFPLTCPQHRGQRGQREPVTLTHPVCGPLTYNPVPGGFQGVCVVCGNPFVCPQPLASGACDQHRFSLGQNAQMKFAPPEQRRGVFERIKARKLLGK